MVTKFICLLVVRGGATGLFYNLGNRLIVDYLRVLLEMMSKYLLLESDRGRLSAIVEAKG